MTSSTNFTDHFLIAMPQLSDPHFYHTVTYICEHGDTGALGITINRPLELSVADMLEQISITVTDESLRHRPVYLGGPVHPNRGFVLHSPTQNWESTLNITDRICLTTSKDILEALARGEGPAKSFIALGYAGWDKGQLEYEIINNAWLNAEAVYEIIFDSPNEQRWPLAAQRLGVNIHTLSGEAGHA